MSTYTKLTWPKVDLEAVCALQDRSGTGALLLNGTLVSIYIPDQVSFIERNFIRSVSITASTDSLTGVGFIISGLQNGAYVTDTSITSGPSANSTVYGTKYFDIILSVTTTGSVTGVKVGTGNKGYLPLISVNTVATVINYSCSILLPAGSGITYSLWQTLDGINTNYITFQNQITKLFPLLTNETTSQIKNSGEITNFILLEVNASSSPSTDTFDFIFLQE